MRVLVMNWQDLRNPHAGGAEVHLHEVFGRLAAWGHQVTFLVSGFPGAPAREEVGRVTVLRTGGRHTFGVAAPRYYRRFLAGEPFDVVVEALNKVPLYTPRWVRRPLLLLVHHLFGTTAFREASAPFAAATWLLERPLQAVYRGVPAEAISHSTRDDLVARGLRPQDIRVVHVGVDLKFFRPDPAVPRAAVPTFVYVGRLKRYKRVDHAVAAVAQLCEAGRTVRLVVAGKGDHEPRLRELASRLGVADRVEFAGFVSEERKRDLLRAAWATVQPSPKEGWGITNIEAAACGTPAVASDSPGLRESVVDGETGILYPHGDVRALAAALDSLAADPARVELLGAAALRYSARFGWDETARETEEHLREVAGRAGNREQGTGNRRGVGG